MPAPIKILGNVAEDVRELEGEAAGMGRGQGGPGDKIPRVDGGDAHGTGHPTAIFLQFGKRLISYCDRDPSARRR